MSAVYLIIAGALLGPIEGRVTYSDLPGCDSAKQSGCIVPVKSETTAETCERAMKEIGAIRLPAPWASERFEVITGSVLRRVWQKGKTVPTETEVLCIPAPSGLRK